MSSAILLRAVREKGATYSAVVVAFGKVPPQPPVWNVLSFQRHAASIGAVFMRGEARRATHHLGRGQLDYLWRYLQISCTHGNKANAVLHSRQEKGQAHDSGKACPPCTCRCTWAEISNHRPPAPRRRRAHRKQPRFRRLRRALIRNGTHTPEAILMMRCNSLILAGIVQCAVPVRAIWHANNH